MAVLPSFCLNRKYDDSNTAPVLSGLLCPLGLRDSIFTVRYNYFLVMVSQVHDLDKDQRKRVHDVIRQEFKNLESCTLDGGGKKVIKVTKVARGGKNTRFQEFEKSQLPAHHDVA